MDPKKHEDLEFAYGSGHNNPLQAVDPGLVYDAYEADYTDFLCMQGYNTTSLRLIIGDNSSFCNTSKSGRAWNLYCPSFSVAVEDGHQIKAVFTGTVTNVGPPNSTYTLSTYMPASIIVTVEPSVLSFSTIGENKSFTVQVYGPMIAQQPIISGAIMWKYRDYMVRSPLVVYTNLPGSQYGYPSFSTSREKPDSKVSSMYHKNGILKHKY